MKVDRLWVYYTMEARGVNSGWRISQVEVGRKWVYLRPTASKRRYRVSKQVYEGMPRREINAPKTE